MQKFKILLEQSLFGVCAALAEKMGIPVARVRLYFIYASCATLGSPILFYLIGAFWIRARRFLFRKATIFE
ncbi:MAG TPA: PspC domain-containing protein [Phaeodactylibacter sp.]|nr:PspC domain-containing protein [Phaeodactylibacter sp.]